MSLLAKLKKNNTAKDTNEYKAAPIEKYEADKNDYNIIGILGKGSFAKVYGAECISKDNKKIAIKVLNLETDDDYGDNLDAELIQISDIQQEAAIMSQLRHENIVSCYASFVVHDELWLIMPFVSGGSISYILSHSVNNIFKLGIKDETILWFILKDTLYGISYMHNQHQIHRDIKGGNILIDGENGKAMLADFGVSGSMIESGLKRRGRTTLTGTPCWMAPEVMKKQKYNQKADIWSFGITALELAFGTTPYSKITAPMKIMLEIMNGKPPSVDSMDKSNKFSKAFKNFISKCLIKDPEKRLSAQELLSTDFIKKYGKQNKGDRQFMMNNFVKYINKMEIKKCHKHDLPESIQEKNRKLELKIDGVDGDDHQNNQSIDSGFKFSWSHDHIKDLQMTPTPEEDDDDNDKGTEAINVPKKKSKFTVTEVTDSNKKKNAPKQSKFTVTT